MLWKGRRQSGNVEDARGLGGGKLLGGGIGAAIIGLIIYLLGGDPSTVMNQLPTSGGSMDSAQLEQLKEQQKESREFVGVVLGDTEDVWDKLFAQMGGQYQHPKLQIFNGQTTSECGGATSASGPFYCPLDRKVYIDLTFYDELKEKFKAPGDFAMAYVVAHEVGHHVQNLMGTSEKVQQMRGRVSQAEYNKLSVMLELQADFYAGVWAHHAQEMKGILQSGDIEEALNAANAIGDDRLQRESQGQVVPDAFTHGTSEQRMRWFRKGFETGDVKQGNTFEAADL
ncbi:MAG: metalloprotease [Sphingobacteriales bacterium]|nr:MAG: metalloprotease [Sphingobacteriales bacterium]